MRARNIKPGFFNNEELAEIDPVGRLLFMGLWCMADREGRLEDRPKRIRAELFAYDVGLDVGPMLDELAVRGFILRYTVDGAACIQVVNFIKHQAPHYKEAPSQLPPPPDWEDSAYVGGWVTETKRQAIFDRDERKCVQCGSPDDLTLDHITPRSKGGTHDDENLQTLCRRCNSAKNNRLAAADHRASIGQASADESDALASDSLIADSLIPDSGLSDSPILIADSGLGTTRNGASPPPPEPVGQWARDTALILLGASFVGDELSDVEREVQRSFGLVPDFNTRDGPLEAEKYVRFYSKRGKKPPPSDWYRAWLNWIKRTASSQPVSDDDPQYRSQAMGRLGNLFQNPPRAD